MLTRSPVLTIHPWGRVEGTLKIGTKPAAGVEVRLSETEERWAPEEAMPITQSQQVQTDSRGHFVFEHVIPATLSVSRIFSLKRSSYHVGVGASRTVAVEADKTTWVNLGGSGRPIVGRFVLPSGIKVDAVFPYYFQTLELIQPEPPYPETLDRAQREAWLTEWLTTDAGKAYTGSKRIYDTNVRPDGRFRVEDVTTGKYRLQAEVHEPGKGIPGNYGPLLANIIAEVAIPEIPGSRSDEALDLGTFELKPAQPKRLDEEYKAKLLKPGTRAPEFEVKTIDGKPLRLADYRGKFVLLEFWATWCGPCLGQTPHLKATYDAFGKDDRLVMMGLSLDKSSADPRQYASSNRLSWHQGFLGDWSTAKLPDDFGVQAIPAIFLIGPDGKILRAGLTGEGIKSPSRRCWAGVTRQTSNLLPPITADVVGGVEGVGPPPRAERPGSSPGRHRTASGHLGWPVLPGTRPSSEPRASRPPLC